MRVSPLVWREASQHHHHQAHRYERDAHVDPNFGRQRIQEREQTRLAASGHLVEYTDAQAEKGLGKVDHLLPLEINRERRDGQVSFL